MTRQENQGEKDQKRSGRIFELIRQLYSLCTTLQYRAGKRIEQQAAGKGKISPSFVFP